MADAQNSFNGKSANGGPAGPNAAASVEAGLENELFTRARGGDRGAFGQLAIRMQNRLYNAVLRVVGDHEEARELTQETLVKALGSVEGHRGESGPYTWMFRIATNLAITHVRKVQRRRTFSLDAMGRSDDQASGLVDRLAGHEAGPHEQAVSAETGRQVLAALGELDVEYRTILVMRDIEDMDYQAMAEVLGVPLGTLKSRLFRARLALREQMIKAGIGFVEKAAKNGQT
jgi:RNA polymerase sigma-70 factor (ECF subfamily)